MNGEDLRARLNAMSTPQLQEVVTDWDGREWTDEARQAAAELLVQRGQRVPEPPDLDDVRSDLPNSSTRPDQRKPSRRTTNRYRDAYRVARSVVGIGSVIKGVGGFVGIAGIVVAWALAEQSGALAASLAFLAILFAVVIFVLGTLVAAQGQILKASLDGAVHSSPFLTDEQRAEVMHLF